MTALYAFEPLGVCETPHDYARGLRRRQTDAERRLWFRLRDRRLLGVKFLRQVPVGLYVVDFCCRERKLIIELDGGQHADRAARDAGRTEYLARLGSCVLRFWNNEGLGNPSPQGGEGEERQ